MTSNAGAPTPIPTPIPTGLTNALKLAWSEDRSVIGLWMSVPDPATAEAMGAMGGDYVNIDMQHGMIDYPAAVELMRALRSADTTVTVRVPWNEPGIIGKVLDAGALGVIIPMVNSPAEARAAVHACRYAPAGGRSYGPVRAGAIHGPDYFDRANDEIACIPMIETAAAVADIDAILATPGIDAIYVGPADLSVSLGLAPGNNDGDAAFDDALTTIVDACRRHGVVAGIHSTPQLTPKRIEQGFRMITATSDLLALRAGTVEALRIARGDGGDEPDGAMY